MKNVAIMAWTNAALSTTRKPQQRHSSFDERRSVLAARESMRWQAIEHFLVSLYYFGRVDLDIQETIFVIRL